MDGGDGYVGMFFHIHHGGGLVFDPLHSDMWHLDFALPVEHEFRRRNVSFHEDVAGAPLDLIYLLFMRHSNATGFFNAL